MLALLQLQYWGWAECLGAIPLREAFLEDKNLRQNIDKTLMTARSLGRVWWVECDHEDNERKLKQESFITTQNCISRRIGTF